MRPPAVPKQPVPIVTEASPTPANLQRADRPTACDQRDGHRQQLHRRRPPAGCLRGISTLTAWRREYKGRLLRLAVLTASGERGYGAGHLIRRATVVKLGV